MRKLGKVADRKLFTDNLPKNKIGRISWVESPNHKFSIRYDGRLYNFVITKFDKEKRIVFFSYNDREYSLRVSGIYHCNIGFIIGKLSKNFKYSKGELVNGYEIINPISRKRKNGKAERAYEVKCIKDGYSTIVSEADLVFGKGCAVCSNNVILKGVNDIWSTNIQLGKLLLNPEEGYLYCEDSAHKVDWKCPCCGNIIKQKAINYIKRDMNVHCPLCCDGYSYPEKLMNAILSCLGINYEYHYRIKKQTFKFKGRDYRPEYDFYFQLNNKKYIIEMDGGFHDKIHSKSILTIEEIKEIDLQKDLLAAKNNIIMIRIDCQYSDYDYIFNSIQKSILSELFNLSLINKADINKKAYTNNIAEVCSIYMTKTKNLNTISNITKIPYSTIYEYLKRGVEIGLCNYDPQFSLKYRGKLDFVGLYTFIL